jgi:hypothetical protein
MAGRVIPGRWSLLEGLSPAYLLVPVGPRPHQLSGLECLQVSEDWVVLPWGQRGATAVITGSCRRCEACPALARLCGLKDQHGPLGVRPFPLTGALDTPGVTRSSPPPLLHAQIDIQTWGPRDTGPRDRVVSCSSWGGPDT